MSVWPTRAAWAAARTWMRRDLTALEYPARPEWYLLFLYQLRHYFDGPWEIIATAVIPAVAGVLFFLLPLLGLGRMHKFAHVFGVIVIVGLLGSGVTLTALALVKDYRDDMVQTQRRNADVRAQRSIQLAANGIPRTGARALLRQDPMTRGGELFQQQCASCHSYKSLFKKGEFNASDLAGFGSRSG